MRSHSYSYLYLSCFVVQVFYIAQISSFSIASINKSIGRYPNLQIVRCLSAHGFGGQESKSSSSKKKKQNAEFEIQELRAQLNTISKSGITPRNLSTEKKEELGTYLRTVLQTSSSTIPLYSLGNDDARILHGTWRMGFSTSSDEDDTNSNLQGLPKEAGVLITFYPGNKCDYILSFSKRVLGLDKLIAKSTYAVDCSTINPGLVTITYQNIVTDVLGMKGVGVGLFGMLKDRATYVEIVWFNESFFVERGFTNDGVEFFNVYVKETGTTIDK